jgi:hypothetical protein
MKRYLILAVTALVFGASSMLTGCGDVSKPEAKPTHSSAPSVGQQYGETLHGAITQAQDASHTLEQANQALGHTSDPEE